jgi:hypothetical protein
MDGDDGRTARAIEAAWPGWRVRQSGTAWTASPRRGGGTLSDRSPTLLTVSIAGAEGCASVTFDERAGIMRPAPQPVSQWRRAAAWLTGGRR